MGLLFKNSEILEFRKICFFYIFICSEKKKGKITMISLRFVKKLQSVQPYQAMLLRNSTSAAAAATPATPAAKAGEKSKEKKGAAAPAKASAPVAKATPKKEETVYKRFPEHIKYKPLKPEGNGYVIALFNSSNLVKFFCICFLRIHFQEPENDY
jgi:hypothetical protein